MKILVQFSGGKDSQVCLIKAVNDYGKGKVTAVFCDTGWEHPVTYEHIHNVCKQLGVELITLKSKKYEDFVDMSIKRGRFPSTMARFCTSELKVIPMIDYILSQNESFIIIQGIRAKESKARAGYDVECSYFKEYVPGHMDDKKVQSVQEAIVFVPIPHMPEPEYIPSEWNFYVANKNGVRVFNVDSLTYLRHKVGERIVMTFK